MQRYRETQGVVRSKDRAEGSQACCYLEAGGAGIGACISHQQGGAPSEFVLVVLYNTRR